MKQKQETSGGDAAIDTADMNNDVIKYYKDENGTLHVPKRKLSDVLIECE